MSVEKPVDEGEIPENWTLGLSGHKLKRCCKSATASVCVRPGQARGLSTVRQVSFLGVHPRG